MIKEIECDKKHVIDNVVFVAEFMKIDSSLPHSIDVANYPHLSEVPISKINRDRCHMIIDMNQVNLFQPYEVIKLTQILTHIWE